MVTRYAQIFVKSPKQSRVYTNARSACLCRQPKIVVGFRLLSNGATLSSQ